MKNSATCDACGKRAKSFARQQGSNLCLEHYNIHLTKPELLSIMISDYKKRTEKKK